MADAQIDGGAGSFSFAREFVRETAIPVETRAPRGPLDSLEPLAAMIGAARIVGIGESAHGLREFELARHALTRFLVERLGFEVVCAETEYIGSLTTGRFVQGEDLPESEAMAAHHFGQLEEVKDLLRWLREHNRTALRPVRFYGIDMYRSRAQALKALQTQVPELAIGLS